MLSTHEVVLQGDGEGEGYEGGVTSGLAEAKDARAAMASVSGAIMV